MAVPLPSASSGGVVRVRAAEEEGAPHRVPNATAAAHTAAAAAASLLSVSLLFGCCPSVPSALLPAYDKRSTFRIESGRRRPCV